jgi:hypothetical protein
MPIKRELRWCYPSDWAAISRRVRFERAGGVCEGCGRRHGEIVKCLPDGRWFDANCHSWRNNRGRPARWPDIVEAIDIRKTRVILAAAHLDHDPRNNRLRNLKSFCQRCHLTHDRPHHLARRRITYLLRRALGDLFLGPYTARTVLVETRKPTPPALAGQFGTTGLAVFAPRRLRRRFMAPLQTPGSDRVAQQRLWLDMPATIRSSSLGNDRVTPFCG